MNRLIIVGNGFDIANGLKTKYSDFLLYYLKNEINELLKSRVTSRTDENNLLTIEAKIQNRTYIRKFLNIENLNDFLKCENLSIIHDNNYMKSSECEYLILNFNSDFFYSIFEELNWSGIEDVYFKNLLSIKISNFPEREQREKIVELNNDLEAIKNILIDYLLSITPEKYQTNLALSPYLEKITESLSETFSLSEIDPSKRVKIKNQYLKDKKNWKIDKKAILNFNYTNLAETLLKENTEASVINIHNSLIGDGNLIFGYGDETHENYKSIEQSGIKEYLDNMKSVHYNLNRSLSELMEFIYKDYYDVYILGHSLGLSDRVLLKEIFENEFCLSIKLFHRGDEKSYLNNYIALTRHFDSKSEMRKKVKPFNSDYVLNSGS